MGGTVGVTPKHELGAVICRECFNVVSTLPTNGVKKVFCICPSCIDKGKSSK